MTWDLALGCLAAGLVIAALTTPVGVSGRGNIAPDWPVGLLCGLGGLADGYLGAMLQPLVPEGRLRQLLGTCAAGICGDGFVGARDDQLHWRDAGENAMGWCDPGRRVTTLARATSAVGRAGGSKKLIGACYAGLACSRSSCPVPALWLSFPLRAG